MDTAPEKFRNMRVLIVDDEEDMCFLLKRLFERHGVGSFLAFDGETALDLYRAERPDLVLLDIIMPGMDGKEVMYHMREFDPDVPIIFMTALAGVASAVEAMKSGAYDYVAKPFDNEEILSVAFRALEERVTRSQSRDFESERRTQRDLLLREMGTSDVIVELSSTVRRIAVTDFDILITGEQGTGRGIVARAIHEASSRSAKAFVEYDCGAFPSEEVERGLFGNDRGVYEEDLRAHVGVFEEAHGGTLFLRDVATLPIKLQTKLLRALQDKAVTRLGEAQSRSVDVRVVVSAHRDLHTLIEDRQFRPDLYYRLNEYSLHVPSLRERKTDIPFLASRFVQLANDELDKHVSGFTPKALDMLIAYRWPGNVVQLRAVVRRAVLFSEDFIATEQLDLEMSEERKLVVTADGEEEEVSSDGLPLKEHVRKHTAQIERQILLETLKKTGWNKAKAARILKIDYKTMQTKVKEYKLSEPEG